MKTAFYVCKKKITYIVIFLFSFSYSSFAGEIIGSATIIDGDTLKIKNEKIRLFGIDAPEMNQMCKRPYLKIGFLTFSTNYNCGEMSQIRLRKYVKNKAIKCIFNSRDRYNRLIAECYVDKKNINSWMVENGYAVAYRKYSQKFVLKENQAKKLKLGLWQGSFIRPEKWRKKK